MTGPVEQMVTISARVPQSLADDFEALAKRHFRSFSAEWRKAMHEYIAAHADHSTDGDEPAAA